ncbi:hypothetical protein ABL78_8189 [Leptomonas seymouri]|uniref:Uncharacterized protein n=1 Tax=Leptomonas seymouri TaxID=5684 RepID=A0A0N0P2C6_LEPSE|nr:hypothetical protein ABL78_8189 [Leptomonas seymouri]|eukprot:KPI82799.1 hypothetical protein ABL78_8189 [Leptomonas seymouri]
MQTRTRAVSQRPLPAPLPNNDTAAAIPTRQLSPSALPSPTTTRRRPSRAVAPLTADVLANSRPGVQGASSVHTPVLRPSSSSHQTPRSCHTLSEVPHMPALSSTATTPTARTSVNCPSEPLNARAERNALLSPSCLERSVSKSATSDTVRTPSSPPARLRSLSDPALAEDEKEKGEGSVHGGVEDSAEVTSQQQLPCVHGRGSESASRLPVVLQPRKLTPVNSATPPSTAPCVLTSPARMASQPDVNALSVTSPARRCCLSAGVVRDEAHGNQSTESGNRKSVAAATPTTVTSALRSRSANVVRRCSGEHAQVSREAHLEPLPLPSPQAPSGNIAPSATSVASRRAMNDSNGTSSSSSTSNRPRRHTFSQEIEANSSGSGETYLRENPRVRTLVNNLYQQVLTVQPEDPLNYLAHLSQHAVPQPLSAVHSDTSQPGQPPKPATSNDEKTGADVHNEASTHPMQLASAPTGGSPNPNSRRGTHTPRSVSPHESPAATTLATATTSSTTTITDTRRSGEGTDPSVPASGSAETSSQQQQRPPLSRAGWLATVNQSSNLNGDGGSGGAAGAAAVVPARCRSNSLQSHQSPHSNIEGGLSGGSNTNAQVTAAAVANTTSSGSSHHGNTSSFAMTVPARTADVGSNGGSNANSNVRNSSSNGRVLRAPPPSAPTVPLATRLTSAGSPANTTNIRSALGSSIKLSSPFSFQRPSFHASGGVANHSLGSGVGLLGNHSFSRAMAHQPSLLGSSPGLDHGEATPSDVSSIFSTNSVDLQEFMAEFRMAKEESVGGGIECPMITLEDLAAIAETVSFPFSDGVVLLDLFNELQPCTAYLAKALPPATSTATALECVAAVAPPLSATRVPGSGQNRRPPREAMITAAANAPVRGSNSSNRAAAAAGLDSAGKLLISSTGVGGVAAVAATAVTATHRSMHDSFSLSCGASDCGAATEDHCTRDIEAEPTPPLANQSDLRVSSVRGHVENNRNCTVEDNSGDMTIARHWGNEEILPATPIATIFDANPTKEPLVKLLSPGRSTGADSAFAPTTIPAPPSTKSALEDSDDRASAGGAPTVPFDTLLARMAFKIQGRYSAEAIRIAFYGMMVDDDTNTAATASHANASTSMPVVAHASNAPPTADTAAAATQISRGMINILSFDSLTPSEQAVASSAATTLNCVSMPSCTVPLLRCLSEGLYARLGMVDVTVNDVQRGVRSAGLPTAPEDQSAYECHLEDFARLVRSVTAAADHSFSTSPSSLCLSNLRGSSLQRGTSAAMPRKEEATAASSRVSSGPAVHPVRHT